MTDKTILEATDAQLADILKAVKDVGVDQYAEYISAQGEMNVFSNQVFLFLGFLVFLMALFCLVKFISDDGDGGWFGGFALLGLASFIWMGASFSSILDAKVQQKAPKGYIAEKLINSIRK